MDKILHMERGTGFHNDSACAQRKGGLVAACSPVAASVRDLFIQDGVLKAVKFALIGWVKADDLKLLIPATEFRKRMSQYEGISSARLPNNWH